MYIISCRGAYHLPAEEYSRVAFISRISDYPTGHSVRLKGKKKKSVSFQKCIIAKCRVDNPSVRANSNPFLFILKKNVCHCARPSLPLSRAGPSDARAVDCPAVVWQPPPPSHREALVRQTKKSRDKSHRYTPNIREETLRCNDRLCRTS